MKHTRRLIYVLAIICLVALSMPGYSSESRAFTILYTNDIHDHLIPFSYPEPPSPNVGYAGMQFRQKIGGMARLATLAKRIRTEVHGEAILVDAGDVIEGTPFGLEYDGQQDYDVLAAAGYDTAVPGNHDFRPKLDVFRRHMATVPCVCANLLDRKTGKPELPEYKIYDRNGLKIAVFGITVPSPEFQAAKDGLDFTDPYETAKKLVPELRKKADVVIALSHLGAGEDEKLAKEVPDIDVIVGGHSHTRIATPKFIQRPGTEKTSSAANGTIIVQDFENGAELGRLDLQLTKANGHYSIAGYTGKLVPVTPDVPFDKATAKVIDKYYMPIAAKYGGTIGEATETFFTDPAVLNLVCDAMRAEAGTDIAIYGIGAVRDNLVKGELRAWDVATAIPYSNKIDILDMTGEQVKATLVRFPVKPGVSGMTYRFSGGKLVEAKVAGKEIDDKATYKVATIDWLVSLYFKGYTVSKELDVTARDSIVNYIKTRKVITPDTESRRILQ